jgi:hypothetical protein
MKSVIRSNMLRGSKTNVGKVTLERSIPTLRWIVDELWDIEGEGHTSVEISRR